MRIKLKVNVVPSLQVDSQADSAGVACRAPIRTFGVKILVQPAKPASQLCTCVNRNETIVFFMDIHNFCTGNRDHLTLLISIDNIHK